MATLGNTTVNSTLTVLGNMTGTGGISVGGTDVKTKLNLIDTINTKINNICGVEYDLTNTSVTIGANYTTGTTGNVRLSGNLARVYFTGKRKSSTSGNITNEIIVTIKADTKGRVKGCYNGTGTNSTDGGVASFYTTPSVSGNTLTVPIYAAAFATSTTNTNGYFCFPISLNVAAY